MLIFLHENDKFTGPNQNSKLALELRCYTKEKATIPADEHWSDCSCKQESSCSNI